MESVKISLIEIFTKLEELENDETMKKKYLLLKKIYQKINMKNELLMKLNNEIDENKDKLYKIKLFNQTSFEELYNNMNEENKLFINEKFDFIQKRITELLFGIEKNEEHECGDNCNHSFDPNDMLNSKKMQKILNNKRLRGNLENQLRKTTGMKNASLEEILKSNVSKEQQKMIDTILNNDTVKKLSETFLNEENLLKVRDIFMRLIEQKDIKDELDKFRCIINEDDFVESITDIYTQFQETQDLTSIERLVKENKKLQSVLIKLEESFKNNTINLDNIKNIIFKFVNDFVNEVKSLDLIKEVDIKNLKNLGKQFQMIQQFLGGEKKELVDEKEKKDKENKRREKARKEYRRKLRKELKNNKNNKKTRGGSV